MIRMCSRQMNRRKTRNTVLRPKGEENSQVIAAAISLTRGKVCRQRHAKTVWRSTNEQQPPRQIARSRAKGELRTGLIESRELQYELGNRGLRWVEVRLAGCSARPRSEVEV